MGLDWSTAKGQMYGGYHRTSGPDHQPQAGQNHQYGDQYIDGCNISLPTPCPIKMPSMAVMAHIPSMSENKIECRTFVCFLSDTSQELFVRCENFLFLSLPRVVFCNMYMD